MKKYKNLFDQITSFENLLFAFYKARERKRNKPNVAAFEAHLERELFRLRDELASGTYLPGVYRTFYIREPKLRMISAAPFRDRVVHHAIVRVLEPLFEKTFVYDSYANRSGKGTHAGIRRCQQYTALYPFVLKCDIQKYFPSIDHAVLKALIARKIGCRQTLDLLHLIIDGSNPQEQVSDYYPGDDLFSPLQCRKGLPMGNLTSQFLANVYLSPLDHFVKETLRAKGYARYVDDFVVFSPDKHELHDWKDQIRHYLAEHLRLTLHWHKSIVQPTAVGVNFLGQRVYPDYRIIHHDGRKRFWHRLDQQTGRYLQGKLPPADLEARINAQMGHIKQANTRRMQRRVIDRMMRAGVNFGLTETGAWRIFPPLLDNGLFEK